jgi:D-alanyl-D-alanine carboxypeptidase/D-alanyl-D-alanine-endopeptidase (penicillin-binding protein 4)
MRRNKGSNAGYFYVLAVLCIIFMGSCSVNRQMGKKVNAFLKKSVVLNDHLVGFAVTDLDKGEVIYESNADKYFIPASNTKLYTFYAGLKLFPDSIPSLRYIERGDSLIFWGTGDPSFLEERLKGVKAYDFLKSSSKQLFFAAGRYTGNAYGQGWAWDDYNDPSQAEITELPLFGNLITVRGIKNKLEVSPQHFNDCFTKDSLLSYQSFSVDRKPDQNTFTYPAIAIPEGYTQQIPYRINTATTVAMLADTLKRPVQVIHMEMPANAKTIYNVPAEQVFREMLLPSDNFIAEQLLLVYSNAIQVKLSTPAAISYISGKYLNQLPNKPRWVDGSGMSRMNLFSPRDMIMVLQLIDSTVNNREKLFSMLPAGGQSGTLKNAYPKNEKPFVFAKTGTFSNNYNQSGYLVTKKGKVLSFALMNNNFMTPLVKVKEEMARMIIYIHDNF